MMILAYIWFVGFIISIPFRAMMSDYNDFGYIIGRSLLWPIFLFKINN